MSQYEFDAERFCLVRARAARAQRNFSDEQNFLLVAEEVKRLREESRNLYAALERIYGRLLMSDRDGDASITEEDGAMAESALKKARGEE